jgi:hypothetical protein
MVSLFLQAPGILQPVKMARNVHFRRFERQHRQNIVDVEKSEVRRQKSGAGSVNPPRGTQAAMPASLGEGLLASDFLDS